MDLLSYFKEKNLKESLEENTIALGAALGSTIYKEDSSSEEE